MDKSPEHYEQLLKVLERLEVLGPEFALNNGDSFGDWECFHCGAMPGLGRKATDLEHEEGCPVLALKELLTP